MLTPQRILQIQSHIPRCVNVPILSLGLDSQLPVGLPWSQVWAAVTSIHPEQRQPGKPVQSPSQQCLASLALRHMGRGEQNSQHQAEGIDEPMPLSSLDVLARVVADAPPCESDLTDWLSRIAAVGPERLPQAWRTQARSRAWRASQVWSSVHRRKIG